MELPETKIFEDLSLSLVLYIYYRKYIKDLTKILDEAAIYAFEQFVLELQTQVELYRPYIFIFTNFSNAAVFILPQMLVTYVFIFLFSPFLSKI